MNLRKDILSRVYLVYAGVVLFALIILAQTFKLQVIEGAEWQQKEERLTRKLREIEAVRGNIYASDGSLLATSIPKYEIRFDANTDALRDDFFYENVDSLAHCLSQLFRDKTFSQYRAGLVSARKNNKRYHLIKRNVKFTELQEVVDFPIFRKGKYKGGFIYTQQNKRVRPFEVLAARTIGYEREGVKPVGLEGAYSKELSGVRGQRLEQKIAGGIWMPVGEDEGVEPEDGSDVYTTIDVNIQDVAETALMEQLQKNDAEYGCVALMEVSTGEIKAIANLQKNKDGKYYESYNYMIGSATEPGSTFKLASLMVGFEDGYFDLDDMVDTENGRTRFYDRVMKDSHEGGYGKISVKRSFEVSSNVAISKIINKYYADKPQDFIDRLYRMGLDKKVGVEISGEGSPFIKSTDDNSWSGITIPWMSIGYELKMTPMQILTFYNAVANDGKMVKPKFVKEIRKSGKLVRTIETEVLNNSICSKKTIEMAQEMLLGAVEEGTAKNLKNPRYKIAGKTGTAQVVNENHTYHSVDGKIYQASFVGYFPADEPKYTCIVVVNAPSGGSYYGSHVAGPIFKEVADKVYASSIEIHDEILNRESNAKSKIPYSKDGYYADLNHIYSHLGIGMDASENVSDWVKVSTGEKEVKIYNKKIAPIYVPDVVGMSVKDAIYILENEGMTVRFTGSGVVKKQSIAAGQKIIKGSKIILELV
jgi:cell division protein FtsI (penicillin-binding protein 3)